MKLLNRAYGVPQIPQIIRNTKRTSIEYPAVMWASAQWSSSPVRKQMMVFATSSQWKARIGLSQISPVLF